MNVSEITYDECLVLWEELWHGRTSPIEPVSFMAFSSTEERKYLYDLGEPLFLGAKVDDQIIGVNSIHRIGDTYRSRGLYVSPMFRGKGIGLELLKETIKRSPGVCWSFPRHEALPSYLNAGFRQITPLMYDDQEDKWNCYVST